jgi:type I restriction enzyme R subunit
LPFIFEASGKETHLTYGYDAEPRAQAVFAFPRRRAAVRPVAPADGDRRR